MSSHTDYETVESKDAHESYRIATSHYGLADGQYGKPRMERSRIVSALATAETAARFIAEGGSPDGDYIVPLTQDFDRVTRTVHVEIDGDAYLRSSKYSAMEVALAAGLNRTVEATVVKEPRLPKPTVAVTEGEMRRVYDVYTGFHVARGLTGGYASLSEARAAATDLVASGKATRASVKGRVIRDTDELLVVTQTAPKTVKVTLEVTEEVPRKGASADAHYVLFWVYS